MPKFVMEGERLRISRLALGHTPTTIARLIASPSSFIHNCEAGERRMGVDKALALKRATGLTLEWIYDGDISTLPRGLSERIRARMAMERGDDNPPLSPRPRKQPRARRAGSARVVGLPDRASEGE